MWAEASKSTFAELAKAALQELSSPAVAFVAIDTEFTGLGDTKQIFCSPGSCEDRYVALAKTVKAHSLVQVGISIFRSPQTEAQDSRARHFEHFTLSMPFLNQTDFTVAPSSMSFLARNGFDFNNLFLNGIPFSPYVSQGKCRAHRETDEVSQFFDQVGQALRTVPVVFHNGLVDMMFLYYSFRGPLPNTLPHFVNEFIKWLPITYDTKWIAQQRNELASFLDYLFGRCVRRNWRRREKGRSWVKVHAASHPQGLGGPGGGGWGDSGRPDPNSGPNSDPNSDSDLMEGCCVPPGTAGDLRRLSPDANRKLARELEAKCCPKYKRGGFCDSGDSCKHAHSVDLLLNLVELNNAYRKTCSAVGPVQHVHHPGAAPLANGAAPSANGAAPLANGAAPSANGAAPLANGAAPSVNGAAPSANGAAPSANGAAPLANATAPSANGAAPSPSAAWLETASAEAQATPSLSPAQATPSLSPAPLSPGTRKRKREDIAGCSPFLADQSGCGLEADQLVREDAGHVAVVSGSESEPPHGGQVAVGSRRGSHPDNGDVTAIHGGSTGDLPKPNVACDRPVHKGESESESESGQACGRSVGDIRSRNDAIVAASAARHQKHSAAFDAFCTAFVFATYWVKVEPCVMLNQHKNKICMPGKKMPLKMMASNF